MDRLSLRDAARRTSRSITTLRRYIRSGKLPAEKLPGRFGPEYFVSSAALAAVGLDAPPGTFEPPRTPAAATDALAPPVAAWRESVPLALYQELQWKHEQLLVQYGMVRAGGLRAAQLEAAIEGLGHRAADEQRRWVTGERARSARVEELERELQQTRRELEGRTLEVAALTEKVRALEMLTRNADTNESIDRQFREVLWQARRVDRLAAAPIAAPPAAPTPPGDRDH